jgi:hypothetical protein
MQVSSKLHGLKSLVYQATDEWISKTWYIQTMKYRSVYKEGISGRCVTIHEPGKYQAK